jgi:sugar phosphate isomerase/epimerase
MAQPQSATTWPALRSYITMQAVESMPVFAGASHSAMLDAIQSAGYHGVQFGDAHPVSVIEETCERGLGMAQFREIRQNAGSCTWAMAWRTKRKQRN